MKKKTKGPGPAAWMRENKWTCIVLAAALAVLLAAVIAVRYALRGRLRPGVQYAMWAIVLVRLLVPVSFGSGAYSAGTAAAALEQTPAVQAVLTPSMDYDAAYSQVAREYAGRGHSA